MDGMGMMLKSLGFDPEQLKAAATQVQAVAQDFQSRLQRIEEKVDFIGASQSTAYRDKYPDSVKGLLTNGTRSGIESGGVPR